MCLVVFVVDSETVTARINILVDSDLVSDDVDISLDFGFLTCNQMSEQLAINAK